MVINATGAWADSLRGLVGEKPHLLARYGAGAAPPFSSAAADLTPACGTQSLWTELRQATRAEGVVHLDDLLLRRVRLGLLALPTAGLTKSSASAAWSNPSRAGMMPAGWQKSTRTRSCGVHPIASDRISR